MNRIEQLNPFASQRYDDHDLQNELNADGKQNYEEEIEEQKEQKKKEEYTPVPGTTYCLQTKR